VSQPPPQLDTRSRGIGRPSRRGQAIVEYVLVVTVLAVALALGFIAFGETARGVFDNVRRTVQMPYP
jgi:Flp pilus assembly pilin Flp